MNKILALFLSAVLCDTIALSQNSLSNIPGDLLISAVKHCYVDQVEKLLKNGVDPNVFDESGKITNGTFPLVIAIIMDTPHCNKIVELLINAGADINIVDKDKLTPLGYAIDLAGKTGNSSIAKLLIERKADVNRPIHGDMPPIMSASYYGLVDVVELLIRNGAIVNAHDVFSNTALHSVAEASKIKNPVKEFAIAELLINNGADVNARNLFNMTPLSLATNDKVRELLRSHGATDQIY